MCVEYSATSVKDNCMTYGGQWKNSACDQKLYQKKCKDSMETMDKNGKTTGTIYDSTYTLK